MLPSHRARLWYSGPRSSTAQSFAGTGLPVPDFQVLQPFLVSDLCKTHRSPECRRIAETELRDIVSQRALLATQVVQKWEPAKTRRTNECNVRIPDQGDRLHYDPTKTDEEEHYLSKELAAMKYTCKRN